jgi:hypothetical protein
MRAHAIHTLDAVAGRTDRVRRLAVGYRIGVRPETAVGAKERGGNQAPYLAYGRRTHRSSFHDGFRSEMAGTFDVCRKVIAEPERERAERSGRVVA